MSNLKPYADTSLAGREQPREAWRNTDWQQLWLVLRERPWTSLAVVPGATGAPRDFALTIAVTLARIGSMHLGVQIHVADATTITLARLEQFIAEVRRLNDEGDLVLIALPAVDDNPVAISIAKGASAAILCILMERMATSRTKKTVDRIGASHFLGSVVFHPEDAGLAPQKK